MLQSEEERSAGKTWAVLSGIALTFLAWGLLLFFVLGDKGPPIWDFSVIPDIPGESAYSTHNPNVSMFPGQGPLVPQPQHVMAPPVKNP